MKHEGIVIDYFEDPDVCLLSRTKALLSQHLANNANSHLIGNLYLDLGEIYRRIRNYPLAHQAWEKATGYFSDEREQLYRATAYYQQGLLYLQERKVTLALDRWNQVLEILAYEGGEGLLLRAQAAYQLGDYFLSVGNLEKAKGYLEDGILFARQARSGYEEARATQGLARVCYRMGNPAMAVRLYHHTLAQAKELEDELLTASLVNDLGYLYEERREWRRAVSAFRYSLSVQRRYDVAEAHSTLMQLGKMHIKVDPEQSKKYCQMAIDRLLGELTHRFDTRQEKRLAQVLELMGLYCREKNDRKNMLMFFRQCLEIYKKYTMAPQWNEVYQIYNKYAPADERCLYDESVDIVNGLPRHEKLRRDRSIS